MKRRTIMVDNRIDLCRHYPVLLVDYHIGEIKYDENEKSP